MIYMTSYKFSLLPLLSPVSVFGVFHDNRFKGLDGGRKLNFHADVPRDGASIVLGLTSVSPTIFAQHSMNVHTRSDPRLTTDWQGCVAWERGRKDYEAD